MILVLETLVTRFKMSSSKSSLGPYVAPTYGTSPAKKEEKKDDTYIYPSSAESGPVYSTGSIVDTKHGVSCCIILLTIDYLFSFV